MTLRDYNEEIVDVAENQRSQLVWNECEPHNAIIMKEIFKHSNKVLMFCGKGSIFRKSFAEIVRSKSEGDYNPIEDLYNEINSFLLRGGILSVILEKGFNFYQDLADNLDNLFYSERVSVYKLSEEINPEYHFSIGDNNKYRREIGAEIHNAFANFNDEENAKVFINQFSILRSFSKPLSRNI